MRHFHIKYLIVSVGLTFVQPSLLSSQQSNEEVSSARRVQSDSVRRVIAQWCRSAKTIDRKSYTSAEYKQALYNLGKCTSEDGARILVNLWKDPSPPEIGLLREISLSNPHETVFVQVRSIVQDRAQSEDLRLGALALLAGYAIPGVINVEVVPNTTPRRSWDTAARRQHEFLVTASFNTHHGSGAQLPNAHSRVTSVMQEILRHEANTRLGYAAKWVVSTMKSRSSVESSYDR